MPRYFKLIVIDFVVRLNFVFRLRIRSLSFAINVYSVESVWRKSWPFLTLLGHCLPFTSLFDLAATYALNISEIKLISIPVFIYTCITVVGSIFEINWVNKFSFQLIV